MAYQKVFDFKEVSLEYRSNGTATFNFSTDMPGAAMSVRTTFTLPSSGGLTQSKTITIALDGIQGTLYQPQVIPGGATQIILLAGVIKLRPIGVYLDGSLQIPEEWITQPIAPGI